MTPEQTEGKHSAVVCLALYFLLITVLRSEVKDIKVSIQQKEKKTTNTRLSFTLASQLKKRNIAQNYSEGNKLLIIQILQQV